MLRRILHLLRKEFRQVLRDPRMRVVIFGVPIIQTLVFGYAVTMDVRNVRLAVVDMDSTPASRALVAAFDGSGYFKIVGRTLDPDEASRWIDAVKVSAVLRINPGYGADIDAGRTAQVQFIVDGSDSNTARLVVAYAQGVTAGVATEIIALRRGGAPMPGTVDLRSRAWFNEDLESRNYYVPGVMAVLVMLVTLMLTGMAIVREREVGTMEQLAVTPIRPVEFILGKCAPFAVIGFLDVALVAAVGVFWFDIPIRGSFWLLIAGAACFLLPCLGFGLFISTVSSTQQQAMMTTFFFFFPAMLLSGFVYPIANMPEAIQWLTHLNPLRHFLIIIRGVFLKGTGIEILWPQFVSLVVLGVVVLAFSVARFRRRLA
jgi:ABC-2 type transport system permease protein